MRKRESGRSRELDEVRRMLFPGLSADEGWARIDAAIERSADPKRWAEIERLAGDDLPDAPLDPLAGGDLPEEVLERLAGLDLPDELLERLRALLADPPDSPDAA